MKFHDEGPSLKRRYKLTSSKKTKDTEDQQNSPVTERNRPPIFINENFSPLLVMHSIAAQQSQLFSYFLTSAYPALTQSNDFQPQTCWLHYVDKRMGNDPTLDWAVRSATCSYIGRTSNDPRIMNSSRYMYSKALRYLARSVSDKSNAVSSETLSAIVLLGIYETFSSTQKDSWMRHIDGGRQLVQLRGPSAFQRGFDRAMFMSFRTFLVAEAFIKGVPCFLDDPEWRVLLTTIRTQETTLQETDDPVIIYKRISERAVLELIPLPGLLNEAISYASLPAAEKASTLPSLISRIMKACTTLNSELEHLHHHLVNTGQQPDEIPSKQGRSVIPFSYRFKEMFSATLLCGIWTALIIFNALLSELEPSHSEACLAQNKTLSDEICKSVEWMAESTVFGSFHVVYALRMTYQIADRDKRMWVKDWLDQIDSSIGMSGAGSTSCPIKTALGTPATPRIES